MAKLVDVESIASFDSLPDPRHIRNRRHLLVDVVVIAVAAIESFFREPIERDVEGLQHHAHETREESHGRTYEPGLPVPRIPRDFAPASDWPVVKAIGYALRLTTHDGGRETREVRYDIRSRHLSGKRFAEAVRSHWRIESMHGVLDVTFREDGGRTRERTPGNNLSWRRRFAVTLLKRHQAEDRIRGEDAAMQLQHRRPRGSPGNVRRLIRAGHELNGPVTVVLDNARYQRNAAVIERRVADGRYHPAFAAFREAVQQTLDGVPTTHTKSLVTLMALNLQEFENVSLLAA